MQKHILLGFLFLTFVARAQDPNPHELQISYGPLAREYIINDALGNFFRTLSGEPPRNIDLSGSYSVTYRYQTNRNLAIGITSGIVSGTLKKDYFLDKGNYKRTSIILAFETRFTYIDRPLVKLYAFTGLGGFLVKETDLEKTYYATQAYLWPTAQLTPFGIRVGKKLGAFAELGYGYKGILNMGLSARF